MLLVNCSDKVYKADISNIESLRYQIESDFENILSNVKERKNELLNELDKIKDTLLSDNEATEDMINKIESGNDFSRNQHETSEFMRSYP